MEYTGTTFKKITTRVRAPRIAVFINRADNTWMHSALRAIEWLSQLWGGGFSMIVPTDGNIIEPVFWQLLESFKPDYCVRYIRTTADDTLKAIDTQPGVSRPILHSLHAFERDTDTLEFSAELKKEIINRLNPFYGSEETAISFFRCTSQGDGETLNIRHILNGLPADSNTVADFELRGFPLEFQLFIRATWGSAAALAEPLKGSSFRNDATEGFVPLINTLAADNYLQTYLSLKNETLAAHSPFARSLTGLSYYTQSNPYLLKGQPVLIIAGSSIDDFALYYCLASVRLDVYWFPGLFTGASGNPALNDIFLHIVNDIESEVFDGDHRERKLWVSSCSLTLAQLKIQTASIEAERIAFVDAEPLAFEFVLPFTVEGLDISMHLFEGGNTSNVHIQQFVNNISTNILPTPKPLSFKATNVFESKWLVDVDIDAADAFSEESGYILPAHSLFARDFFYKPLNYIADQSMIRFTGDNVSFFCPTFAMIRSTNTIDEILIRPQLKLLVPFEIFRRLFENAGYRIETSDKGNFMQASIDLFGSLQALAGEFKDKATAQLLANFGQHKNQDTGVYIDKRCYMSFDHIQKVLEMDTEDTRQKIDSYITGHIFTRGHIFKCSYCLNADWYSIGELTDSFTCTRCRKSQAYVYKHWRSGAEPSVYYKLNEIFYQGLVHNMAVPVLALAYLKAQSKRSFMYIPEVKATLINDSAKTFEMDILCVQDGNIIIGESKVKDALGNEALERYLAVCSLLRSRFLFATTDESYANSKAKTDAKKPVVKTLFLDGPALCQ